MRVRIRLEAPTEQMQKPRVEQALSRALRLDLAGVRALLASFPTVLPLAQSETEAEELSLELAALGLVSSLVEVPAGRDIHCTSHPGLLSSSRCRECSADLCLVCERTLGGRCTSCLQKVNQKGRRKKVRIGILLLVLFVVCLVAAREWRRRHLGWERPQRLAVVLVEPKGSISPQLAEEFAARAEAIERSLADERRRYAPSASAPIELSVLGPVAEQEPPPVFAPAGLWDLLRFNLDLGAYARAQDRLAGLNSDLYDVRIYVRVIESDGRREAAEGLGQEAGQIGIVSTYISEQGIDFAWFVAIHEYLHTRGAQDKYDARGRAMNPQGLADPDQDPLFPQSGTELMARGRPVTPESEDIPGPPETWVVGRWTAAEIGWSKTSAP